jgi:hypothetical protein
VAACVSGDSNLKHRVPPPPPPPPSCPHARTVAGTPSLNGSYADDADAVFEVQPTEVDNLLQTSVRLLDLVDLEVTALTVSFNSAPWITATVRNNGIETASAFSVDFYQVLPSELESPLGRPSGLPPWCLL